VTEAGLRQVIDITVVLTSATVLMFSGPTQKARLLRFAPIHAVTKVVIGLEEPDSVEIHFGLKQVKVRFLGRAHDFVQRIVKSKQNLGSAVEEEAGKRSEMRKDVKEEALKIDYLLGLIGKYEEKLHKDKRPVTAQSLLSLYNKAIEYYSNSPAHKDESQLYISKIKEVFSDA
jgi:K+-sensing histidine kinase KdpD